MAGVAKAISPNATREPKAKRAVLSFIAIHLGGSASVGGFRSVLTKIFLDIFIGNPLDGPATFPGPRICSWIVHRHFILQRIQIWPGKAFGQMQGFGMRQPPVRKPELLVEADHVDNQGIFLPMANRITVVRPNLFLRLALLATISIYDPPVAVSPP